MKVFKTKEAAEKFKLKNDAYMKKKIEKAGDRLLGGGTQIVYVPECTLMKNFSDKKGKLIPEHYTAINHFITQEIMDTLQKSLGI
jgi:hypothetical protein